MTIKTSPLLTFAVSAAFGAALAQPAMAADIETLVGQVSDFAGPNVTIIIDTSGSMTSDVLIDSDAAPYDPGTDYIGPYDVYENSGIPNRLFFTAPDPDSLNFPDENDVNSDDWIAPSAFDCANGQAALLSAGVYTDRFAQFIVTGTQGNWVTPEAPEGGPDDITECATDFGVHGDGSGAGSYPININPVPDNTQTVFPWTPLETDPNVIDWASTGGNYSFFTPNFLNWIYERKQSNDPVVLSRLEIVQRVATDLVQNLKARSIADNDGLRLGLMRFSENGSGGMVLAPTVDLATSDTTLIDEINQLTAFGTTPLAETMYEAYLYHAGAAPEFGFITTPVTTASGALEGGTYKSPIEAACQKNYVILLTDGVPNADFQANNGIESLTGECDGNCLDEMTNFMSNTDLATGTGFAGDQTVETFIIGFFTDQELLENATTGQIDTDGDEEPDTPGYFLASNPEQLTMAFEDIFGTGGIQGDVATFTAPAVTVNTLNRFTNRDTLYFTLYKPSANGETHWDGNLKAYRIGRGGDDNSIQILDATGQPAVDADTGLFEPGARSLWTSEVDGGEVAEGGVAARLSAQRNIYSDLTDSEILDSDNNRVTRENAAVIGALPQMPEGEELLQLIDFAAGLDDEGMSRRSLGDPLHSQPLVINFGGGDDDLLLVFGTNDGYLHAIDPIQSDDTSNDMEHFAFIPKALIPQLADIKTNSPSNQPIANKAYGMDGPITAWIEGDDDEIDEDRIVGSGEKLWVYAGMRRGGRGYYGFDLTNPDNPLLKFRIDNQRAGYGNLGQTWSSASYARIKRDGVEEDVLIFGGGYDPNQDDDNNSADSMGNAVYIANARTGDLIWSAGGTNTTADLKLDAMTHSIPSDVRIIDTNSDGFIDRLYVGDMAAQVWRFDINENPATPDLAITGGRIADFGAEGDTNDRRFYSAPSVSRYVEDGRGFLAIGIGSGYRAHPLNQTIDDKFYVIRDDNVYRPAVNAGIPEYGDDNPALLTTEANMIELTLNGIESGETTIETGEFGQGWFLSLDASAGEKSLSSPVTAEGRIFFTTYSPDNPALSCDPVAASGLGRFYGIDILTGLPALYGDALTAPPIASVELGPTGIPPQPKLIFVAPDCDECSVNPGDPNDTSDDGLLVLPSTADIVAQVGTQAFDIGLASRPTRTFWVEF